MQLKAVDFFCGGGGMSCGMAQAGIDVILGIDNDIDCKETYEYNNKSFLCADITELSVEHLKENFNVQQNDDNMIFIGCSPCQYYSIINVKKRTQQNIDKNNIGKDLIEYFKVFVEYYNPGFVVVENVPGFQTKEGSPLANFIAFLKQAGYNVNDQKINANHYGVPQNRKRFILIASRVSSNLEMEKVQAPYPTMGTYLAEVERENNYVFPVLEAGHNDRSDAMHLVAGLTPKLLAKLRDDTPINGGDAEWRKDPAKTIPAYIKSPNSFTGTYGRLAWNKPASTITTKFTSISNGRFAHPVQNRALSIREGATLQTFPLNYVFKATSISAIAKLIGNAVPPLLGKKIAEAIKRSLKK